MKTVFCYSLYIICTSLLYFDALFTAGGFSTREVVVTFSAKESVSLTKAIIACTLQRILYKGSDPGLGDGNNNPLIEGDSRPGSPSSPSSSSVQQQQQQQMDRSLQGSWDDTMKSLRVATDEDLAAIAAYQTEKG